MKSLQRALTEVEQHRKRIELFTAKSETDLVDQFSTKNVSVVVRHLPSGSQAEFVIIRGPDGEFLASMGLDIFRAVLSPEIHPPWELSDTSTDFGDVFDFLDNTVFSSFDRQQMLATAREIEERAWRHGAGRIHTGFQNNRAMRKQISVYEGLADRENLHAVLYVSEEWNAEIGGNISVISSDADEIGQFWFVLYDGGGSALRKCGMVAEERRPGRYYGFWTYDPDLVDDIIAHLSTEYGRK